MPKKNIEGFQVRVGGQLAKRIEALRAKYESRVSRPAYVEMLLKSAVEAREVIPEKVETRFGVEI